MFGEETNISTWRFRRTLVGLKRLVVELVVTGIGFRRTLVGLKLESAEGLGDVFADSDAPSWG